MAKNNNRTILFLTLLAIAFLIFYYYRYNPPTGINNGGAALGAVIVDGKGNIIKELVPTNTQSIVSPGGGFSVIDNVNSFLAIRSTLDNSAGDSDIIISNLSAKLACSFGNNNAGCGTIFNKFGGGTTKECTINADGTLTCPFTNGGDGYGALNALYYSRLSSKTPLTIKKGSKDIGLISEPIKVNDIQLGFIDFVLDMTNISFIDNLGNLKPLLGKFGSLTLNVEPETCTDGTKVDLDQTTLEAISCSTSTVGKYCAVSSQGTPSLIDKASFCGCASGFVASGDVCVGGSSCGSAQWPLNSCNPGGGILYCKADGSIVSSCNLCLTQCPKDVYGQTASSCSSTTDPSQCIYPAVTGASFNVALVAPSPTTVLSLCGDGVKNGNEQCDKTDFGGVSCISGTSAGLTKQYTGGVLTCTASCTYNEAGCTSSDKFRTGSLSYPSTIGNTDSWISWSDSDTKSFICGNSLIGYGLSFSGTAGTCAGFGTPILTNLPHTSTFHLTTSGSGIFNLFRLASGFLAICEDTTLAGNSVGYQQYTTANYAGTSPLATDTQGNSVDPTREVVC